MYYVTVLYTVLVCTYCTVLLYYPNGTPKTVSVLLQPPRKKQALSSGDCNKPKEKGELLKKSTEVGSSKYHHHHHRPHRRHTSSSSLTSSGIGTSESKDTPAGSPVEAKKEEEEDKNVAKNVVPPMKDPKGPPLVESRSLSSMTSSAGATADYYVASKKPFPKEAGSGSRANMENVSSTSSNDEVTGGEKRKRKAPPHTNLQKPRPKKAPAVSPAEKRELRRKILIR